MIVHSVIFKFKKEVKAEEKQRFFEAVDTLENIEGVQQFEVLEQISPKNAFQFGISMAFESESEYKFYSEHPKHEYFIHHLKYVDDFLEIDYKKKV